MYDRSLLYRACRGAYCCGINSGRSDPTHETGRYDEVIALADATLRTAKHVEELFFWRGLAQKAKGICRRPGLVGARAELNPNYAAAQAAVAAWSHDRRPSVRRHIARNVLLVASAFTLAAAMGLLRNMIVAHLGIGPGWTPTTRR